MKILMDITFNKAKHNGITVYSNEIIKRLYKNLDGIEIELSAILYPNQRNEQTREYFYGLYNDKNITFLKKSYIYGLISKINSVLNRWVSVIPHRYFKNNNADIMCFFYNYIPNGVATNKKIVVVIHDLVGIEKNGLIDKTRFNIYKHTVSRADLIVTVSEYSKGEILKYFPEAEGKIIITYNGVDNAPYKVNFTEERLAAVRNKYGLNKKYIFFIGQVRDNKNLPNLIKAYNMLSEKLKDEYDLVLSNSSDSLKSLVAELGINDKVKLLHGFDEEDKAPLLKMSSALCLVSTMEGFGIPIIEAMAAGVPVVTSNVSCMPEVAGGAARLVTPYDTESISEGISEVLTNGKLRTELIAKGYVRADYFTWDNAAKAFAEGLKKLQN